MQKPKMAVIRGIRAAEALFYDAFKKTDIKFIYFSQNKVEYPIKTKNLRLVNELLKPRYFCDPIAILNGGNYTNRSLIQIENLEKHIKNTDIVCLSDTFYSWCDQAANLCNKYNKKLVTVVWETIPNHPSKFVPPYNFYIKNVVKKTDLFLLRSKLALKFAENIGIPKGEIKVIYKGVDLKLFFPREKQMRKSWPEANRPSDEKIKILYVGQLTKAKGVGDLLNIFVNLCNEFNNIELIVAGRGRLEERIKSMAKKYPIKYLGFVNYFDLPQVYREADIFCSPSKDLRILGFKVWEELFSYTLMEAMASGLPIVATKCGGIPEEIGDRNFLVKQGNREGMYNSLKSLIVSNEKRKFIGLFNRRRAEKMFDANMQAQETEKIILSIM
ncbi:MAG: hypothetical protein A3E68_02025 [Candidatus Levybacteria bacterium RIFCSPHIGHO2_12_FULL_39_39]|nr:MAG: hypothetical protein A2689_00265 [Candidatus Levybacteria bacterium RIFCSPHIGHO2_01_FULL_38_96]OGH25878.1 MAG: hypothetical protein A3E68_02025 [Candidatus Levybacteria bacterium RIFCSPHIGHO2_12_FULL_39_39]OGH46900.1 MAG: hypothetical protein A3G66_02830 [Candidatus Levybacteria bacterium RIFCSPLOWO2_12_FULL_39_17]